MCSGENSAKICVEENQKKRFFKKSFFSPYIYHLFSYKLWVQYFCHHFPRPVVIGKNWLRISIFLYWEFDEQMPIGATTRLWYYVDTNDPSRILLYFWTEYFFIHAFLEETSQFSMGIVLTVWWFICSFVYSKKQLQLLLTKIVVVYQESTRNLF